MPLRGFSSALARQFFLGGGVLAGLYASFLALLTNPTIQSHIVYLHGLRLPLFANLSNPAPYGFLPGQVDVLTIPVVCPSGKSSCATEPDSELFAWHILPLHEAIALSPLSALQRLASSPSARLVIHLHGAGSTVASGHRPASYRAAAMLSTPESPIHVLSFDYRGFGQSPGVPTEAGLVRDAMAVLDWAIEVGKVPPERIVLYGQSLGTAVAVAMAEELVRRERAEREGSIQRASKRSIAGMLLVAPFTDVPTLMQTYRITGLVPVLGPVARIPAIYRLLQRYVIDKWPTAARIQRYIHDCEDLGWPYGVIFLHAQDDNLVPWMHSRILFQRAVRATAAWAAIGKSHDTIEYGVATGVEEVVSGERIDAGEYGEVTTWTSDAGVIREEILRYGVHDVLKEWPQVGAAILQLFEEAEARHVVAPV